eukprot:12944431-Alexandrium_andersonii.AAC.1
MSASLVGSEMCIRDSLFAFFAGAPDWRSAKDWKGPDGPVSNNEAGEARKAIPTKTAIDRELEADPPVPNARGGDPPG